MAATRRWPLYLMLGLFIAGISQGCVTSASPPPALEPAAQERLLTSLKTWPGGMTHAIDYASAAGKTGTLSLGQPRSVFDIENHLAVEPTHMGWERRLERSRYALIPVQLEGEVIGAIEARPGGGEGDWSVLEVHGRPCAEALENLRSDDKVFFAEGFAWSAMLVARGENVFGVETCSDGRIPPVSTMTEYHEYIEALPPFSGYNRFLSGFWAYVPTLFATAFAVLALRTWRGSRLGRGSVTSSQGTPRGNSYRTRRESQVRASSPPDDYHRPSFGS